MKNITWLTLIALSLFEVAPVIAAEEGNFKAPVRKKSNRKSRYTRDDTEASADRRKVLMTTGEDKIVDIDFEVPKTGAQDQFISIGNPNVVAVQVVGIAGERKQLVFKPLKGGETTVSFRDEEGNVKVIFQVIVTGNNLLRRAAEIRELVHDIEGLEIKIVGQKIVIDGEVLVPQDYGRLMAVVLDKSYSDFIMNLATLSPHSVVALAKRIQDDLNAFAPNVRTRVVNGMIFLEGTVDSADQAKRAAEVANLYLPEAKPANLLATRDQSAQVMQRKMIWNFIVINAPPPKKSEKLVRVTVHFVELNKNFDKYFGFKWEPGFTSAPSIAFGQKTGDGSVGSNTAGFSAVLSSLIPRLQTAQSAGFARVLKNGTVIVRSGQPGKIEESTSIPMPTMSNGVQVNTTANIGLTVAVTPQILGQGEDVSMDLNVDQRALAGKGLGGMPYVSTHAINTKIYVKNNESAAIGGIQAGTIQTSYNKQPPYSGGFDDGAAPLFTMQRDKDYNKKKSQFVIFVTPQIIESASEGTEDLKKNFRIKVN